MKGGGEGDTGRKKADTERTDVRGNAMKEIFGYYLCFIVLNVLAALYGSACSLERKKEARRILLDAGLFILGIISGAFYFWQYFI